MVTSSFRLKQKVQVTNDRFLEYAHDLSYGESSDQAMVLRSKSGAVILRQKVESKEVVVDCCDYLNLFNGHGTDCKVSISKLESSPVHATAVTVALIKAGDLKDTNFTEHLKVYFDSPKILHPGHVFCLKVPETVPANIPLKAWIQHISSDEHFNQPSFLVHFKVVSAFVGDDEISDFFYISSEKCTLYEAPNVHEKIPSYLPDRKIDLYYSAELALLESQLNRDVFRPVILTADRGSYKLGIVRNICGRLGVGLVHLPGVDYCGEAPGSLETKLSNLKTQIKNSCPCVVYLDNLELMGRTRDGTSVDARVVLAMRQLFDDIRKMRRSFQVYIVGSCAEAESVAMEVRHLFEACAVIPKPDPDKLFKFFNNFIVFDANLEIVKLMKKVLKKITFRKALNFIDKLEMQLGFGLNDKQTASLEQCKEVFANLRLSDSTDSGVPDTKWEDIGGIDHVRREIEDTIEIPLKYAELFGANIKRSGLLLYGKPGCGKTMVARAIASQCNLSFISVQGPELLNSFVGQSEDNVRTLFEDARAVAPTVLFFDEIDAIAPRRSGGVIDRILAQLLTEMDGIQSSSKVYVIAATNRPELLDPAIMRPGRLDKRVEVSVGADVDSRVEVFKALSRDLKMAGNVCFKTVAEMSGPLSGAECYGVLLEACYRAVERCIESGGKEVMVNLTDLVTTLHTK